MNKRDYTTQQAGYAFAKEICSESSRRFRKMARTAAGIKDPDNFDKGIIQYCTEARQEPSK